MSATPLSDRLRAGASKAHAESDSFVRVRPLPLLPSFDYCDFLNHASRMCVPYVFTRRVVRQS